MSDFLSDLVKELKDENTTIASEGKSSAEFSGTIDTGSYLLNAVISGSLYGGVPNNKITGFAGEMATGKTFFVLGVVSQFLKANPEGGVIYFDTESAVTNDMMESRGITTSRVVKSEPETIQKFRHTALQILNNYLEQPEDERRPMIMILDSLGQLSTTKEVEDTASGSETRDMTKAQVIKATFRVLNLRLAKAGVPLLVTNHVYEAVGSYIPMKEMSGGSGLKYSASTIVQLSKTKERVGTEVVGNIIKVKMYKSRLSRENKEVGVLLSYDRGLDRYYGLVDHAVKAGVFNKSGNRIELPDGSKQYAKTIYENPEKYFTDEVMTKLEEFANAVFSYGVEEREGDEHYEVEDSIE